MGFKISKISLGRIVLLFALFGPSSLVSFAQNKIACTQPVVSLSANVTICNGSTTTLTGTITSPTTADYTWVWTPTSGLGTPNTVDPALTNTTTASPTVTTTYTVIVTDQVNSVSNPVMVTVSVNPSPTVTITGTATLCNGASTTLTAAGGTSYVWAPGGQTSTSISVTPSAATGYTVTGTNANSCTNTFMYNVSFFATPTVTVNGINTVCNGSGTTLTASGANTYVWAPSGSLSNAIISNPVASPTTTTTYTVTGTSVNSCTATATYSVSVSAVPTLTLTGTSNTICNGLNTTLDVSGGSSYVWSPSGSLSNPTISNPVANPITSTNYTVVATGANSCTKSSTYSVTVYATPAVSITGANTICNGGGNLSLTGNGASTYVWNPGSVAGGTLVVSPTSSGTYTVTGTDGNGCTGTASQTYTVYPQPTANAGADVSVCAGDNTTLTATGNGTFVWSPASGLSCTTCANPVSTPTAPITYTLTVTNNCGSATDEVSITYPALPSANAGPDVTICPGSSTTLTGSGSGTFVWSPSTGLSCVSCVNPVANPSVTTTYTFSINASCGTNSDDVTVTLANPVASVTGNTTVCAGQTTTLTASGGTSYVWNTGASTNPITDNPTTTTGYTVIATDASGCTDDAVITVTPSPLPAANAGADVSICIGSNTTLSVTGTGTYLWSPATGLNCTTCANPTADPTVTTTYTVTVTNNCGSVNDMVDVTITTTPSVNAGADATICAGGNASLNASGSGTYVWSPSTGLTNTTIANPVANPTATTDYTVTITDACGTASDVVTVNVNSLPAATISGSNTVCSGISNTLVAGGGGTYQWNTGSTNAGLVINPTVTTGYTVTVTSAGGCTDTANFTVSVSTVSASIVGTNSTVCAGQSSTLTASGGATYVWSTGSTATTVIVSPTVLTNYTVTATGSFGCTKSATYSVSVAAQPTASVTAANTTVCAGSINSLSASGGTSYVWSPATGLNNSTIANPVSTVTANITYIVIVSNGGCTDTASIAIAVNALPTASVTATQASICVGSCDSLFAAGGTSYLWSPGGATTSAINACPTSSASYTVTTTDANGCTDEANVLINVLPVVVASVSGDTVICNGDIAILTAQGGGTYSWNTGQTTSSISVNPGASSGYTVTVSNGACSDTASINVNVNSSPAAIATASPYTINIGATTTLSVITSTGTYTWSPTTGLSCDTCANPAANPTATTIYTVVTADANGCTAMDTVTVYVTMECEDIFVPNAFSPNGDGFNDHLYVRNPCILDMEFSVYNRWGQKVFYTTDKTAGWDGMFHGKHVDPAVFFYTLTINFITGTSKHTDGNVTLVR